MPSVEKYKGSFWDAPWSSYDGCRILALAAEIQAREMTRCESNLRCGHSFVTKSLSLIEVPSSRLLKPLDMSQPVPEPFINSSSNLT
jgi:hypothetical protein